METIDSIGKQLAGGEQRDAVHFAIAPVMSGGFLKAGQRVVFASGSTERVVAADYEGPCVGIIDPFLPHYVAEGKRCWLFLMPGTITGLRHEWTHPAFVAQAAALPPPKAASELWLRGFADRYSGDYEGMVSAAVKGDSYCFGDDIEYEDFHPESEFWRHVEIVTGRTLSNNERQDNNNFRCAC